VLDQRVERPGHRDKTVGGLGRVPFERVPAERAPVEVWLKLPPEGALLVAVEDSLQDDEAVVLQFFEVIHPLGLSSTFGMRCFDAAETADLLPWGTLVDALDAGFRDGCEMPVRHHHPVQASPGEPGAMLLLMPAWTVGGYLGVKVATVFPGNTARRLGAVQASYILSSAVTGEPLALIDGLELTLRRTAAASALAARFLARPDARSLLVVGAGNLAPHLAGAHAAVNPSLEVEFWARRPEQALAASRSPLIEGLATGVAPDLERAVPTS